MTNMSNAFIKANTLGAGANGAHTENGAISYNTIGTALLDQFGKAGVYRGRAIEDVWTEQATLWSEDKESALKFPFYLRMITRQANIINGGKTEKVQRGQGAKDESFKRLLWIAKYHPEEFYRNLWVLPIVGSWKDLWVLLSFEGADYLDHEKFFTVIAMGINDDNHRDLVKKYMPRIRSNAKCNTAWAKKSNELAKEFANFAGWSYSEYREFKSTGKAHEFQRVICSGLYSEINWKNIPGKALLNLVSGKFLNNHGLNNAYIEWLKSQPVAKFNGYPFELGRKVREYSYGGPDLATKITVDKQFAGLIETAKKDGGAITGNVLCGLDNSGSMTWTTLDNAGTMPLDVCLSLGVYFAELNTGAFHNVVAAFDDKSSLINLSGDSFCDRLQYLRQNCRGMGSTNFQSLVDLIVDTRKKNPDMPLEDFPETLLVVSDMQFNPTVRGRWLSASPATKEAEETNYQTAISKLRDVFPKEYVDNFKIVWWYCSNRETSDFPSTMEDAGTYMISGYDGAVISFLLGGESVKIDENGKPVQPSMEEIVSTALNQEVLTLVQ